MLAETEWLLIGLSHETKAGDLSSRLPHVPLPRERERAKEKKECQHVMYALRIQGNGRITEGSHTLLSHRTGHMIFCGLAERLGTKYLCL